MRRKTWVLCAIAGVIMVALGWVTWLALSFGASDQISQGVRIEGINVGGLTKAQCRDALASWAAKKTTSHIVLAAVDKRQTYAFPDLAAKLEVDKAVDEAYAVGRHNNIFTSAIGLLTAKTSGADIKVPITVDNAKLEKIISKMAKLVDRPHSDAKIVESEGRLTYTHESCGIKLNQKQAVQVVLNALKTNAVLATLPVETDAPDVTYAEASRIDTLLARFTTTFNPAKEDRTQNLALAAKAVNGVVVRPGGEFSYNDAVGPRVKSRGFKEAIVFVKGKMKPGIGGGICQVSSTLYNAALLAGLDITERHIHSRTVTYVTAGRDATVAFGIQDFRFKNPLNGSIGILTQLAKSSLTVDIYGSAADKKDISIYTGPVAYMPIGETQTVFDATLPAGVRKVIDTGSKGAKVTVYRSVKTPDGQVKTETVSTDLYRPQPAVVGVGPKKAQPTATRTSSEG